MNGWYVVVGEEEWGFLLELGGGHGEIVRGVLEIYVFRVSYELSLLLSTNHYQVAIGSLLYYKFIENQTNSSITVNIFYFKATIVFQVRNI